MIQDCDKEQLRISMEKEYEKNPHHLKHLLGFYRIGDHAPVIEGTILFPVKITDARKIFGKLQCKISPYCGNQFFSSTLLGEKWVERRAIILSHDHEFTAYSHVFEDKENQKAN
jgi:hypothetical protein